MVEVPDKHFKQNHYSVSKIPECEYLNRKINLLFYFLMFSIPG